MPAPSCHDPHFLEQRSNCLAAAFRRWWRHGGSFAFYTSKYGPFAHITYRDGITGQHLEFVAPSKRPHRFPPLIFWGSWRLVTAEPGGLTFGAQSRRRPLFWVIWLPVIVLYVAIVWLWVGWTEIVKINREED